jgi:CheY-like chemotaxis protein/DNA-directed RNA polymerase specialized sigma24 family protein
MSISQAIGPHLPFLRRYARALTGTQDSGDRYVVATLEAILQAPSEFPKDIDPRVGLYQVFQTIWAATRAGYDMPDDIEDRREQVAQQRLATLTPRSRQALLLTAMEGFTREEAGTILDADDGEIVGLLAAAIEEIDRQTATDVLIIEDEPIIAMDLEGIVQGLGHKVAAIADTRTSAVAAARSHSPGLVLADIQLADGSSGIDAVTDILNDFQVPVIFITAYPDRLLTGERPEPTFLITKPFQEATVKAAISQALFFESSARMN